MLLLYPIPAWTSVQLEAVINFSAVFSAGYRIHYALHHCDKLY
jgi:hypothetical protein